MQFIKNGSDYFPGDVSNVVENLPVRNYIILLDPMRGYYLQEKEDFKLPAKIYGKDTAFIDRVIKTYKKLGSKETLGIILNGLKGTGKTIDAEMIAIESGLPVIFLTSCFFNNDFKNFLSSITQEYVLFIDEFEKIYDHEKQQELLSIFDGMLSSKKIVILTCNEDRINQYFNNRLKRIRYRKTYRNLSNEVVKEVIEDLLENKDEITNLLTVISDIGIVTMDILISIIEEMNFHNYTATEAVVNLNIITEKAEYKLSRVLPNGNLEFIKTFETAASVDAISFYEYFNVHESELKNGKQLPNGNQANVAINTKQQKPIKIAFGKYEFTAYTSFPEAIVKGDPDFDAEDEEENIRWSSIPVKYILEKEYLFKAF